MLCLILTFATFRIKHRTRLPLNHRLFPGSLTIPCRAAVYRHKTSPTFSPLRKRGPDKPSLCGVCRDGVGLGCLATQASRCLQVSPPPLFLRLRGCVLRTPLPLPGTQGPQIDKNTFVELERDGKV